VKTLHVVIPGPPGDAAANRARKYASIRGRARSYQSRESKSFRQRAAEAFAAAGDGGIDCDRMVQVRVVTWWPRWSRRYGVPLGDVDATAKQVCDAIAAAGVVENDLLIEPLILSRGHDPHRPRIEITITQEERET
jgi:Holliday junction resolvase RusA-like endonuclease